MKLATKTNQAQDQYQDTKMYSIKGINRDKKRPKVQGFKNRFEA